LRLEKAAQLVRGFRMTESEVRLFSEQGSRFDGFDWNSLQFQAWDRLAGWCRVRNRLKGQTVELASVGLAATGDEASEPTTPGLDRRANAIAQLKLATLWPSDEVDFLVGPSGLNMVEATDFLDERTLARLEACIELSHRLGVSCATLFHWANQQPDSELADAIVAAAKAKYDNEEWIAVAKPLNDVMRERQKTALVTYILANDVSVQKSGITDGNGLFEYFLIDVEMSACAKTSRIKQAIASVQLFIQRCLLNLEDGVSPSSIDIERWEWMKNYRVWEANRKIFLYPENWIEPELRDDKSPFFKELESSLLQNDLSWSLAEEAYVSYLEKLDQVAKLRPCGMVVQEREEPDDDEIVHVFARTESSPPILFYRRLINGERWTPWEKLDQEINSDHLIPIVRNRRLYLMWLLFEEKPDENQELPYPFIQSMEHWKWLNEGYPEWKSQHDTWREKHAVWRGQKAIKDGLELAAKTTGKTFPEIVLDPEPAEPRMPEEPPFSTKPPLKHWEIKLAWMEYKDGQWSGRQTSTESIVSPHVMTTLQDLFVRHPELGDFLWHMGFYKLIPPRKEGSTDPADYQTTIFSVHLPKKSTHFARIGNLLSAKSSDDGPLNLWIFRRYSESENALDQTSYPIQGYETIGCFQFDCGRKVSAFSFAKPITESFESLARPSDTTNESMRFVDKGSDRSLRFATNKKQVDILRSGQAPFEILYDHHESAFSLRPPYQSFFYNNSSKTYYVSYAADVPAKLLRIPANALAAIPIKSHVPLLQSLNKPGTVKPPDSLPKQALIPGISEAQTIGSMKGISKKLTPSRKLLERTHGGRFDSVKVPRQGLRFDTFFHPHLCEWMRRLYQNGLTGLLTRDSQRLNATAKGGKTLFEAYFEPTSQVVSPFPTERVDFDRGAYAGYNWELFFHIPMLIACSLSKNQRFEDAMKWFHFIFNPMTDDPGSSRQRFWNTLPFYENSSPEHEQIQNLLLKLAGKKQGWKEIETQIDEWRTNPFNPHGIARMRLTAYQKHVVMKYLDNIIAWADQLFSRDTLESINEATMLYILAGNILGKRPETIPRHDRQPAKSYHQLAKDLDAFGNALVEAENLVPFKATLKQSDRHISSMPSKSPGIVKTTASMSGAGIHKSAMRTLHFCVPPNEEMLRYWDTVEDRLFKIRHCMNIEGTVRELPLFEPPIDPALLVKAKAAGLDLGSVLNDLFAPMPHYRFSVMIQKATDLCNELKSLGNALLSALEKRDAEALSNLRATQETNLLKSIREVKQEQIREAKANIEALTKSRLTTETRYNYYRDIERISTHEKAQLDHLETAFELNLASQVVQNAAGIAFQFPNLTFGTSGAMSSPVTTASLGGSTVGAGLQSAAGVLSMIASQFTHNSSVSSIVGGYARRWEDWKLQERIASRELDQIDKQIAAAEIRLAITERELANHEQQISDSEAVGEFLRTKYTNQDLYNWMIAQTSKVYFQTYKLAYDLAKRAERTYREELGISQSDFVRFGYWDNLRKGLLAGEQLAFDLKRMDVSYLEKNKRDYELTKHISLLQLDPRALIQLRQTGECELQIPEWWFDLDTPGHYLRRIKYVSLSIPCVTGPYSGVNCQVTLLKSTTRVTSANATDGASYGRKWDGDDTRFVDSLGQVQSIVVSTAQNDSGLFETNLRDERYLPFENSGVISTWKLRLPADPRTGFPNFDYETISDVVLHLRYTAREGGDVLRKASVDSLRQNAPTKSDSLGLTRLFSVRHEFPTEWARFLNQPNSDVASFPLTLKLRKEHYPFWARKLGLVSEVRAFVRSTDDSKPNSVEMEIISTQSGKKPENLVLALGEAPFGNLYTDKLSNPQNFREAVGDLQVLVKSRAVSDVWFAITLTRSGA
jgi:hypothetical protein